MSFLHLKALHIIFVVTWFAGLFYIVRLFIYHTEANNAPEPERSVLSKHFLGAERRLWYGI
ncbi:MAG TPA: CopD family protein, partial [Bacteroidia bacterium]|nr:CopD family protein [Bacteroidia bacterium]